MTVFDTNSMLTTVAWSDEHLYLKEFVHKHDLPAIVRVVKGQYMNLGVPSLSNPSLHSTFLIIGLGKKKRIVGQCVKFKDNHKVVAIGPKLAVPSGFDGFFEILSEDGRSVKCIESVSELVRRFPDSVLVRENVKAFVSKSDDVQTIQEKSRIVETGETLILVGEVGGNGSKFLRCLDKNGENIYLPVDLKGRFSAIAKEDNISGVHSAENLLNKRLPLMARLVHGLPPQGLKSSQQFAPEMRMFAGIDEECLVALTLSNSSKEPQIISLPIPAMIKVQYSTNMSVISTIKEFQRLKERCLDMSRSLEDRILIHDITLAGRDLRLNGSDNKQRVNLGPPPPTVNVVPNQMRRISSSNGPNSYPPHTGDDYDEIEQIYDYVRGFAPLPKGARGWKFEAPKDPPKPSAPTEEAMDKGSDPPSTPGTPPEPPPLETLPSRKGLRSPVDPNSSSPLWSGNYGPLPVHNISENIYDVTTATMTMTTPTIATSLSSKPEAKKRQRRSCDKSNENRRPSEANLIYSTPALVAAAAVGIENGSSSTPRFIKSANYRNPQNSSGGYKLRFFRNKSLKETPVSPATIRRSSILEGSGYCLYGLGSLPHGGKSLTSPSPVFNMRYKSMTNLATSGVNGSNEYDTLDSSGSGGKTISGDSGGGSSSRNQLPEKRSRKLSRPKSLTNLVWSGLRPSSSKQCLNGNPTSQSIDQKKRLEPGDLLFEFY